jgi:hypothetical protein
MPQYAQRSRRIYCVLRGIRCHSSCSSNPTSRVPVSIHDAAKLRFRYKLYSPIEEHCLQPITRSLSHTSSKKTFSWIEEYRVYWSLWHIQHHSDLQTAAHGRWHWSPDSKRNIAEYINWAHPFISDIEDRRLLNEQIWAILAVLMDY